MTLNVLCTLSTFLLTSAEIKFWPSMCRCRPVPLDPICMRYYRSLPGKRPGRLRLDQHGKRPSRKNLQDHCLYTAISNIKQYLTLTQSMGPKITLFEKKPRWISRIATMKPIRRVLAKMTMSTISIPSLIQMTS